MVYMLMFALGLLAGGIPGLVMLRRAQRLLTKSTTLHDATTMTLGASSDQLAAARKVLAQARAK